MHYHWSPILYPTIICSARRVWMKWWWWWRNSDAQWEISIFYSPPSRLPGFQCVVLEPHQLFFKCKSKDRKGAGQFGKTGIGSWCMVATKIHPLQPLNCPLLSPELPKAHPCLLHRLWLRLGYWQFAPAISMHSAVACHLLHCYDLYNSRTWALPLCKMLCCWKSR